MPAVTDFGFPPPTTGALTLTDLRLPLLPEQATVPVYTQEAWTSRQRQASSIHEISYRACFKPQLPAHFITRLTRPDDVVYDPFSGRGTTAVEAALHGRRVIANDINPLSTMLTRPRLEVPELDAIEKRLDRIGKSSDEAADVDLSMFFQHETLTELIALRSYLHTRTIERTEDAIDRWIRMVATNRLTGHSKGFFSVYTLPPNQAASAENQIKINIKLGQKPEYRDTHAIILRKSQQLQRNVSDEDRRKLHAAAKSARFFSRAAHATRAIKSGSVQLTVTSPPFLDVVHYARDNWLRCWFNGLNADEIAPRITMSRTIAEWKTMIAGALAELYRVTKPDGWVAFEVGEVRKGKVKLEEHVLPLALAAGFKCEALLINEQRFTKTAKIWGVGNNSGGTNTNRIVLLRKA